jgi:hypothetical protein
MHAVYLEHVIVPGIGIDRRHYVKHLVIEQFTDEGIVMEHFREVPGGVEGNLGTLDLIRMDVAVNIKSGLFLRLPVFEICDCQQYNVLSFERLANL